MQWPAWLPWVVAGFYGLGSLVAFVAYGLDKRAAIAGRRRTPERTLYRYTLLGGWPGALLAMRVFRHKRRKAPFVRRVWAIVALHGALWIGAAWLKWG